MGMNCEGTIETDVRAQKKDRLCSKIARAVFCPQGFVGTCTQEPWPSGSFWQWDRLYGRVMLNLFATFRIYPE